MIQDGPTEPGIVQEFLILDTKWKIYASKPHEVSSLDFRTGSVILDIFIHSGGGSIKTDWIRD